MEPNLISQPHQTISRKPRNFLMYLSSASLVFVITLAWFFLVPVSGFPAGKTITVPEGATLSQTAEILKQENVISSTFLFRVYIRFFGGDHPVLAGSYLLNESQSLVGIADRIMSGDFRVPKMTVLVTEGMDVGDIAQAFVAQMPSFDSKKFLSLAVKDEGYLFPDTYFFFASVSPEEAISTMKNNFDRKTAPLQDKIAASGHSSADIITMASIIERETVTPADRRIVSGILWKRISLGMPLQVDAAFNYINGKGSASLTAADLKSDSPYNTYTHKGLTPGPICNPGLDTILAAIEPTQTKYLYYLSDKNGVMHYAQTFDQHKSNKLKYLD